MNNLIGSRYPEEYAEMESYNLRAEYDLVRDFDKTVNACVKAFAAYCRDHAIEEVTVMVPKTVKVVRQK